jgi:hypothetical protein
MTKRIYEVTKTWYIEADDMAEAVSLSQMTDHSDVHVKLMKIVITKEEDN